MSIIDADTGRRHRVPFDGNFDLADFPTSVDDKRSKKTLKKELAELVEELYDLQRRLFADARHSVLVVFQAMDAAGKDSTIRKVFSGVNPAGFRCTAFGRPSSREIRHDFLWRCQWALPERGKIGIFNRSHYEEVLVVRVHPEILAAQKLPDVDPETIWQQRMRSICDWERHLAENGTVIVKFFLNVSREEQKARFLARIDRAEKNWKFERADLDVRERWEDYMHAYEQVLRETSSAHAPWYAIPADDKRQMRADVARIMVETLRAVDPRYPRMGDDHLALLAESRERLLAENNSPVDSA